MFRIPVSHLSAAEAAGLAQLQAAVMRLADYAAQVAGGKKKWAGKPAPLFGRIKARLRDYAGQSKNWDLARRGQFIADFRAERYRTVWLEMLRQRKHNMEVDALLSASPESLSW